MRINAPIIASLYFFFVPNNSLGRDSASSNLVAFECDISRSIIQYESSEKYLSEKGKRYEPVLKVERVDLTDNGTAVIYEKGNLLFASGSPKINVRTTQAAYLFDYDDASGKFGTRIIGYIDKVSGDYFMKYIAPNNKDVTEDKGKCKKVLNPSQF